MIDLSKLQKGDVVKHRNGGESVLECQDNNMLDEFLDIDLKGSSTSVGFYRNGLFYEGEKHPFDIVEIIPAQFDWSTVKAGMAFTNEDGFLRIFECWSVYPNSKGEKVAICTPTQKYNDQHAEREHPECLTRLPEHDIEVDHG